MSAKDNATWRCIKCGAFGFGVEIVAACPACADTSPTPCPHLRPSPDLCPRCKGVPSTEEQLAAAQKRIEELEAQWQELRDMLTEAIPGGDIGAVEVLQWMGQLELPPLASKDKGE